jgi:hypothetical protein
VKSYLVAIVLLPLLMAGWIAVQAAWRRRFSTHDAAGDVLADRRNCGQCGCATPCEQGNNDEIPTRGKEL